MVFLYSYSWLLFRFVSCYWWLIQLLIYCLVWFFLFPWHLCSSWKKRFLFHTYMWLAILAFVLDFSAAFSFHTSSPGLQLPVLPVLTPVAVQCLHVGAFPGWWKHGCPTLQLGVLPFPLPHWPAAVLCCAEGHSGEPEISDAPMALEEIRWQKGLISASCSAAQVCFLAWLLVYREFIGDCNDWEIS